MKDSHQTWLGVLGRVVTAGVLGALAWWLLLTASGGWIAVPRLLLGMLCLVTAAVLLAPLLARLIAEPFGNLFNPSERFDRPQPMYSVPQGQRAKGLFEEAMAGFEQIAREYPDEVQPYIEMIDIAIVNLQDQTRAAAVYQRGLAQLPKPGDRAVLTRMYDAIRSRLNPHPNP